MTIATKIGGRGENELVYSTISQESPYERKNIKKKIQDWRIMGEVCEQ